MITRLTCYFITKNKELFVRSLNYYDHIFALYNEININFDNYTIMSRV